MARNCADTLVGGAGAARSKPAWLQAYRALDHTYARERCGEQKLVAKFPKDIADFANTFVDLQIKRHDADYDPAKRFSRSTVLVDIESAEEAIARFSKAPILDRRAFAALVVLKKRRA